MNSPLPPEHHETLKRLDRIAFALDYCFKVPVLGIRVGWESILGFVPFAGDAVGLGLGAWLIYEAHQAGAPRALILKMAGNTAIDTVSGMVPFAGNVVDVFFKSNARNIRLLRQHLEPESTKISPRTQIKRRAFWLAAVALTAVGAWQFWTHFC